MSFYEDRILPHCIDFILSRKPVLQARERVTRGLHGEVLEIGFGSGLNVPYYPREVTKVFAIDPSELGKQLAAPRIAHTKIPIEWSGLDGQVLPFADASVDCVLSTFTFCTIPDLGRALFEVKRVLRPGGKLHFVEHGRSPETRVAKWQDRLTPINKRVAGGCHLNRAIDERLREAGFCLDALDNYYLPGPKLGGYLYEGRAHVCNKA